MLLLLSYIVIFIKNVFLTILSLTKSNPNIFNRMIQDRTTAKQSLLRWPGPIHFDSVILGLCQNSEYKVKRANKVTYARA